MADSKTNKSTKKTVTAGKSTAKNVEKKPPVKAKPSTGAEAKASSAKPVSTEATKAKQETKPTASQKPKEKGSGKGMAFLALLCAMGALGLSGFNFYQQHMSPNKAQTQDALLSGVNDIKANVTEFGTVVSDLQQDVEAFKSSQEQYVTVETLNEAVKEGVDKAVTNLPDLPEIGPVSNGVNDTVDVKREASNTTSSTNIQSSSVVDNGIEPLSSASGVESSNNVSALQPVETGEVVAENEDDIETGEEGAWTLSRAKQDFKDMLMGFISIKKTDQSDK